MKVRPHLISRQQSLAATTIQEVLAYAASISRFLQPKSFRGKLARVEVTLSPAVTGRLTTRNGLFGDGSAELLDDGSIEIEFAYQNGDEAVLKAKLDTSSTAC